MNLRQSVIKTGVLVAVLCGLGLYYYFYEVKGGKKRQEAEEKAKKVFQIDKEKVAEFRLAKADGEEVVCKKTEDKWYIEEPVKTDADQNALNRTVSEFVDAKRTRTIEEEPEDLVPYGLDKPALKLSAVIEERDEPATLLFGNQNPATTAFYAKTLNEKPVFLVQSYSKSSMDKSLQDLRNKEVVEFQTNDVAEVHLERGQLKADVEKQVDGTWMMTSPMATRGDKTEIENLLDKIQGAKVKEFVNEDPESLEQYGLDSPTIKLTTLIGEDRASKTLLIGRKDEEKKGHYAKRAEQKNVFLLAEDVVEAIPAQPKALRDSSLLTVKTSDVQRMVYVTDGEKIVLAKDEQGGWEIKEPTGEKADTFEVDNLIADLAEIKAQEFFEKEKDEFGFATPQFDVKLWKKDSDEPLTLVVGATDENLVYARNMDGHAVAFEKTELDKIRKTLFDLRDKTLVSFDTTDVSRMAVRYADHELVVIKEDDNWQAEKPERLEIAEQSRVDNLCRTIRYLTMVEIVEEQKPQNLAQYGLDDPQAEFSVALTDGKSVGPSLIGGSKDGNIYVVTKGKPGVYLVQDKILDDMRRELGEILDETLPAPANPIPILTGG